MIGRTLQGNHVIAELTFWSTICAFWFATSLNCSK